MHFSITDAVALLRDVPNWVTLVLVTIGSGFEYIFPPFPGDTTVLAAATIAAWNELSPWVLILVATLGSIAGAGLSWKIGDWFIRSGYLTKLKPQHLASVNRTLALFERYGAACLAFNRFLPGLRSFFFLAAAMARISFARAIFWAAISGLVWSAFLVYLGATLASNVDRLEALIQRTQVIGLFVAVFAALLGWAFWKWRQVRSAHRRVKHAPAQSE